MSTHVTAVNDLNLSRKLLAEYGQVVHAHVIHDRESDGYIIEVLYAPNTLKEGLKDPVFVGGTRVKFHEAPVAKTEPTKVSPTKVTEASQVPGGEHTTKEFKAPTAGK